MNDRRKFRSQTSDLWTDAATVVGRVREERVSRKEGQSERKDDIICDDILKIISSNDH